MKFKKLIYNPITRLFTMIPITHYTTQDGAKGIMKDGFKNDSDQQYGLSVFRSDLDTIRNNNEYNVNTMMDNLIKRRDRFWNSPNNHNGVKSGSPRIVNYGNTWHPWFQHLWGHKYNAPNPYNQWHDKVKDVNIIDGPIERLGNGEITFPQGYKNLESIDGLNNGYIRKQDRKPIYRVVTEADDKNMYDDTTYESRVPISDIDNTKNKLEIPNGMYDGSKKLKRGYINDYMDFNESDYNMDDQPTAKAISDIKKKQRFLKSSHGKK